MWRSSSFASILSAVVLARALDLPSADGRRLSFPVGLTVTPIAREMAMPPGVQVTPDGSWIERTPFTNGHVVTFTVTNTQSSTVTYDLTAWGSANMTVTGQSYTAVTLGQNESINVNVNFNVGAAGPGWVKLSAEGGNALDTGTWNVASGHSVAVTPDGQTASARITQTGQYTESFTVKNNGGNTYTYTLTCGGSSNISCTGVSPVNVTLNPSAQTTVYAAYNVGSAGTGTLRAVATYGTVTDTGSYSVPINNPTAGAPIVDASPMYGHYAQNMARCAMSCFAATYAQSTVPYFSLDAPRSVTLAYHGDRSNPKPFVNVDVRPDSTYGQWPSEYRLEVKVSGVRVPFVNGDTILRFAYAANTWVRLGGQFDRSSYATNVYPMDISVSAYYSGGGILTNTWSTKLVLVNENDTLVAWGWTIAGVQRLYPQGDGSALITEGEGSVLYFAKVGSVFVRPAGEFSQLLTGQPGGGSGWTRAYPDSTKVVFNSSGRMIEVRDRFNNITTVVYDGNNRAWKVIDPLNKAITLSYDANGLTSIQDPGGRVTDIVAASKRLTTITDPDNVSTTFGYDGNGRLSTITGRRGHTTTLGYDSQSGKLATVTAPAITFVGTNGADSTGSPVTTLTAWQKAGVPYASTGSTPASTPSADTLYARVTDAAGHTVRFTVNRWGTPAEIRDTLGFVTTTTFDANGLPIRVVHPTTAKDTVGYNASGLPVFARAAGHDSATYMRYAGWAQVDSVWGYQVPPVRNFIGASGRVDSTRTWGVEGAAFVTRFRYDTRGRPDSVVDPLFHLALRTWYAGTNGNRSKDSLPGGRVTTYTYDTHGRPTSVRAPGVATRGTAYDVLNRVTRDSAAGLVTIYSYDSLYLKSVTDPRSQVYTFKYNALGWMTARVDPTGRADTVRYDRDGLLRRWKNRRLETLRYSYDAGHRLTGAGGANTDSTKLFYSIDGRVVGDSSAWAVDSQFFNADGRLDSLRTRLAGQTFTQRFRYTSGGQLDSVAITGGGVTFLGRKYKWHPLSGALDTIRLGGGGSTGLVPNADGQLRTVAFPGGDTLTRAFTSVHDEATISTTASYAQAVSRFVSFDAAQRIARQILGNGLSGHAFAYDSLGRLTSDSAISWVDTSNGGGANPCTGNPPPIVDENGNLCTYATYGGYWRVDSTHVFSYDVVGNRLDQGGSYGSANRIRAFGGCTYVSDSLGDGNVLSRTCGTQTVRFYWGGESRLKALKVVAGDSIDFRYDAGGRLVRKDVNGSVQAYFLWEGANLLAELNATATGKVGEYSYYPGLDNPHALITDTTPSFAHVDAMGNVIALTDSATQTVQRSYEYDPWGRPVGGTDAKPFTNADRARFKGALWLGPQADVYYMRARWYEPQTGRFLSEDPIGLAGGINSYVYAGDDPINRTDPWGECEWQWILDDEYDYDNSEGGVTVVVFQHLECVGGGDPVGPLPPEPGPFILGPVSWTPPSAPILPRINTRSRLVKCSAQAFKFALNVTVDLISLTGIGAGFKLVGRGLGAMFRGGLASLVDPALSFGFQTAGQIGRRRAVSAAGRELFQVGALDAGVGGLTAYDSYDTRNQLYQAVGSGANTGLSLLPGYGMVTSGIDLVDCLISD